MKEKFKAIKNPMLIAFAAVNCALPFLWSWAGKRFDLSVTVTGLGCAGHEFLTSLLSFLVIRSLLAGTSRPWLKYLQWSLLCVAIGDLMYGFSSLILRLPPGQRGMIPIIHEGPYVLFAWLSAAAVLFRAFQGIQPKTRKWIMLFVGVIASVHFVASYDLILNHFFHALPKRPLLIYTTSVLYGLGQSVFVGGLLVASVRTLGFSEFILWSSFLVMAASDFLLRYQDITGPIPSLSIFEYGWELAFSVITVLLLVERQKSAKERRLLVSPAPLNSLRVITATVTLASLLVFVFLTSWFLSFLKVATAANAGVYTMVFTLLWATSNAFSITISQGLRRLHAQLIAHSIIPDSEIPAMAWEVSDIFSFLHNRNIELHKERDKALEEALRLKTESAIYALTHKIMHDVKAPLSTLVIMLDTDLKDLPAKTKDKIRQLVGRIRAIIDTRLKQYSEDAIARTRQPKEVQKPTEAASIGGAIQWILEEEQPKAAARGVTITCDLPKPSLRAFASTSFSDLCRILSNLLINAIDAAEQGGHHVYITARIDDASCEIVIRDSGKGFDPDALTRVLANEKVTTKSTGTGLGLVTVRGLISQAGGELQIQSQANGTTMRIRLPLLDTPQWFYDISKSSAASIVALDDDATIKQRLEMLFPDRPIEVFATEDEFLKSLQGNGSSLALVDYDYGGPRSGIDLIVAEGLTRNAVLLSGRLTFDHAIRADAQEKGVRLFPKECLG